MQDATPTTAPMQKRSVEDSKDVRGLLNNNIHGGQGRIKNEQGNIRYLPPLEQPTPRQPPISRPRGEGRDEATDGVFRGYGLPRIRNLPRGQVNQGTINIS